MTTAGTSFPKILNAHAGISTRKSISALNDILICYVSRRQNGAMRRKHWKLEVGVSTCSTFYDKGGGDLRDFFFRGRALFQAYLKG